MMSLARAGPTRRGRRCVPPPPGMMPSRISGWPSGPCRRDAEVAGQGQLAAAAEREAGDRGDRGPRDVGDRVQRTQEQAARSTRRLVGGPPNSEMSAPAAKTRSPPVTTTAPGGSSRERARAAPRAGAAAPCESALTFGWSRRTTATPSSRRSTVHERGRSGMAGPYRRAQSLAVRQQLRRRRSTGRGARADDLGRERSALAVGDAGARLARAGAATIARELVARRARPAGGRARPVDSRCARCAPMAAHRSSTPSPVDARRWRRSAAASRPRVGQVEHLLEVAAGLVDAGSVGLVDHEHVGDLEQPGLVGLHRVAPARVHDDDGRVGRARRPRPRPGRRRPSRPSPTASPTASSTRTASGVASDRPPRWPRVAIERMNTPASRAWSCMRTRSPRMAPPGERRRRVDGEHRHRSSPAARRRPISAFVSVDLPAPGAPVRPTV